MIEIRKMSVDSKDAQLLIHELNQTLKVITGDDGTTHFRQIDVEQKRSIFLIGYIDDIPYACGALRELDQECGEIKRVYARKNDCHMGSLIMERLEDNARTFGYQKLLLETRIQNKHAISFYEKNGYAHCENYGVYQGRGNAYCFMKVLK